MDASSDETPLPLAGDRRDQRPCPRGAHASNTVVEDETRCRGRSSSCAYDTRSAANALADDPELLRLALEIVDSWDDAEASGEITVAWSEDTAERVGVDGVTPKQDNSVGRALVDSGSFETETACMAASENGESSEVKPTTVASTQFRRREEIAYLREKEKELQDQLAALQAKQQAKKMRLGEGECDATLSAMWRDVAACQYQRLQRAKLDGARLRHSLETQMRVSKDLLTLMKKVRCIDEHDTCTTRKRARVDNDLNLRMDEDKQLEQMDQMYQELETLFTFYKFHDGTTNFVDISVTDTHDEIVIEFCEAWTLPFDADSVLDALWEYNRKRVDPNVVPADHVMNTTVSSGGDIVLCHCLVTSTKEGFEATGEGQLILRRYRGDEGRTPAMFTAMDMRPSQADPGDLRGVLNRDLACIRVVSLNEPDKRSCPSQVQISQRAVIQCQNVSRETAGFISDFVLGRIKSDIELKHEMVESILLRPRTY